MRDLIHSAALWVVLCSLVLFSSMSDAQDAYVQHMKICPSDVSLTNLSSLVCRDQAAVSANTLP